MNNKKIFTSSKEDRLCSRISLKLARAYEVKNYALIKSLVSYYSIPVLVKALEKLSDHKLINIALLTLEKERMRDFFLSFSDDYKLGILNTMRPIVLSKLLTELQADQVSELLSIVEDSHLCKKIIYLSSPELRRNVSIISNFSHSQIGSIMNTSILTLPANLKIFEALTYIRRKRHKLDLQNELFVINLDKNVVGTITLQDLFFNQNDSLTLQEVMEKDFITFSATDQIGDVVDAFQKYPVTAIAILNKENQILGVVTNEDIIPEIVEESIEDVYRFYGIVNLTHSYMKSTTWEVVKSRLFWLIILLFATTLTTLIVDKFEKFGSEWTAGLSTAILIPLIPLITDMCGNSGSQTAASIIQSFASEELNASDFWYVLKKELKIAFSVGAIVSLINFVRLLIYYLIFPITIKSSESNGGNMIINHKALFGVIGALVSSIALFLVIVFSKLLGVSIPYLAHKFKKDPAALTTPVLTTILDAMGALIFFSIGIGVIMLCKNTLGLQKIKS